MATKDDGAKDGRGKDGPAKDGRAERDARLAAALRANLRRRKAQAAAPGEPQPTEERPPDDPSADPQRPIA